MGTEPVAATAAAPQSEPPGASATARAAAIAAGLLGLTLTSLWIWWSIAQGGFFPVVYLPGGILLYATLITLLLAAPLRVSLRGPHAVAVIALLALVAWTALSIAWSPARDVALEDAQRTMIYPAAFLGGLLLGSLLRHRLPLCWAPWLLAATVAAIVTLVEIAGAEVPRDLLDPDQTLDYPLGYRNANAAFFVICALILVGMGARRRLSIGLHAVLSAVGVACLCLALLSQSRGSVLAAGAGVLALLAASPERLRALIGLAIIAIPTAALLPELLDPFAAEDGPLALEEMQDAADLVPFAALAAGLLTVPVRLLLDRFQRPARDVAEPPASRRLMLAGGVALLLAVLVAAIAVDDPTEWISRDSAEPTDNRFTFVGGNFRDDFWSVALDQFAEDPLVGGGSGSFRTSYALERTSPDLPKDAHGLPFETLGELGAIGAILVLAAIGAIGLAVARSRRLGIEEAALAAAAIAAGAAWLAQASIDWLSSMPAATAFVLALLGVAAGPAVAAREARGSWRAPRRSLLAAPFALAAVAAVPLFISERLTFDAATGWRSDPAAAVQDLDRAADLNPLADAPFLVQAVIAKESGDTAAGLAALQRARDRQPDEWLGYFLEAQLLAESDPAAARIALREAERRNPRERDIERFGEELQAGPAGEQG